MCDDCGCSKTFIGNSKGHETGKPQDPYGKYDGVGGTNKGAK